MSTPVVRVGVGALLTCTRYPGCVLVGIRKGSHGAGMLALPGGHLDIGEEWAECAAREVMEETALKTKDYFLNKVTNDPICGGNPLKHYITVFMQGEVDDSYGPQEAKNMEPHKWYFPLTPIVSLILFISNSFSSISP